MYEGSISYDKELIIPLPSGLHTYWIKLLQYVQCSYISVEFQCFNNI